jgi:ABC-type branched-subunit amino acid transport system substrate-binding protein
VFLLAILLIGIFAPLAYYTIYYYCWYIPNTCAPYGWIKISKVLNPGNPGPFSVLREPDGECIGGISNGNIAFDTASGDGSDKKNAAEEVMDDENGENAWNTINDVNGENAWNKVVSKNNSNNNSSDAEPLIYREDQCIENEFSNHKISNYYDIVVATMLTGDSESVNFGRDNLQGMYVAQDEYNYGPPPHSESPCPKKLSTTIPVRLLVANIGGQSQYAKYVAGQIVKFSQQKQEKAHFLGVIGWPTSLQPSIDAIGLLNQAKVTTISPTASTDQLTGPYTNNNSFFFRIILPVASDINPFISYAENHFRVGSVDSLEALHLHPVAFYDTDPPYSKTFCTDMKKNGLKNIRCVGYSSSKVKRNPASLEELVQANVKPAKNRLVFFMGYGNNGETVLKTLYKNKFQNYVDSESIHDLFLGGDTLYQLHNSSNDHYPPYANSLLNFAAAAYPDNINTKAHSNVFVSLPKNSEYTTDFGGANPNSHRDAPYGYTRADQDVILSYDGLSLMIQGAENMPKNGDLSLTAQLREALAAFNASSHPFPGESGPIYFLGSGDNQGGQVLIICVDRKGDGGVCYG